MNTAFSRQLPNFPANSPATDLCGVSVIIPARNAAATLLTTLLSIVRQTYQTWQAIIVDDGSTDNTCRIAQDWADKDRRFRVIHQDGLGVSAARNRGLREARYAFVLFLDSDDRIAPLYLQLMTAALSADASLDAVHCGWQRILESGEAGRVHIGSNKTDLFPHFAFHCHFAIHTCVLKRDLAIAVGGFDPSLKTCEDWDFFQRVAGSGARFGLVPEVLAFYLIRLDSASRDNKRCLIDGLAVVDRAYREDPRIGSVEMRKEPLSADLRILAFYNMIVYCAAQEIGAGRDGLDLLNIEDLSPAAGLTAAAVAEGILEGLPIGANCVERDWPDLWRRVSEPLSVFLKRLEGHAQVASLAYATLRNLEQSIVLADLGANPLLIGNTFRINVELSNLLQDVVLPSNVDRLICRLTIEGKPVGILKLPGCGVLSGERIAEAVCEGHSRLLLEKVVTPAGYFQLCFQMACEMASRRNFHLLAQVLSINAKERLSALKRLKHEAVTCLKINLPQIIAQPASPAARQAEKEWQEFLDGAAAAGKKAVHELVYDRQVVDRWDRIFSLPDPWVYDSDYEAVKYAQTLALLPEGIYATGLEIACAEGHFTARLANRVKHLTAVDISVRALDRARERCADHDNIDFQRLDLNDGKIPGPFDLVVCSEVLYYVKNLETVVSSVLKQVRPGGYFLTAHSRLLIDEVEATGFAWDVFFTQGAETIAKSIAAQPGIALLRELRTPLYRILLYQRVPKGQPLRQPEVVNTNCMGAMTPAAEELARWQGRTLPRRVPKRSYCVPILMYHRIAAEGPPQLARYRTAPQLFQSQIAALHQAGYRTIRLMEWINAIAKGEPLPGKPIILTFDDGYQDYLTAATPVLRRYGFSATVFLVAQQIGKTAEWDSASGPAAPLLSWDEIRALQQIGVEFGCHSSVHRPMTGMSLRELAQDVMHARGLLEEGLNHSVSTLAYPYGEIDEFVVRTMARIGLRAGVTCESGISHLGEDPLRLRRLEVRGGFSADQLIGLIESSK